jgi:hypothetical protein
MGTHSSLYARSAALGAATGLRSTLGVGALALRGSPGLGPVLAHPAARPLGAFAVGVELVLDKLPMTGSRLEPVGLVGRLIFAGVAATALALAADEPPFLPVFVASATALAAAKIGHDVRAAVATKLPDPVVAVVEDALAITLAAAATAG